MGRLKVETSLAEGMRRRIHRRCIAESAAESTAGSAVRSLAVFALRVVLAEGSASWVMLACAPYIGVVEITENFRRYFLDVWAAAR